MFTRRLTTAAVLLVLFGASCANHNGTTVAAGAPTPAPPAAAALATTTTTTATTVPAPTTAVPAPSAPAPASNQPVVKAPVAAEPEPASIEVDYQPHDGDTAFATIVGPNGTHSKSLDGGSAVFSGLDAGTYAVTITIDSPSNDPNIDDARQILKGNNVHVEPGEHGVITCGDEGCAGTV